MRVRVWGLATAIAVAACSPHGDQQNANLLEQGRLYTAWLYGNQYQKLWDRFSPDMRQTFGSVADLASFAGRAVTRLGVEKRVVDERVDVTQQFPVYSRAASFDKSRHRMLIEWSLAKNGDVTGLVVRPELSDSQ
ncbi:MAG TPA: hypothetical protein VH763_13405 [Gemmatimonadales bacterium]|jgi:hypothetical protein